MSAKAMDGKGRWRSKVVALRMSPEENALLDRYVGLSGMSKQDYIISRVLMKDVVVQGNPRVYKALKNELAKVQEELRRIETGGKVDDELAELIKHIAGMMNQMKEEPNGKDS